MTSHACLLALTPFAIGTMKLQGDVAQLTAPAFFVFASMLGHPATRIVWWTKVQMNARCNVVCLGFGCSCLLVVVGFRRVVVGLRVRSGVSQQSLLVQKQAPEILHLDTSCTQGWRGAPISKATLLIHEGPHDPGWGLRDQHYQKVLSL